MAYTTDVKIAANGRLVLPQSIREALGVKGEARLIATLEEGAVRLSPMSSAVEKARRLYRENVVNDASSDDFLKERREEEEAASRRGR